MYRSIALLLLAALTSPAWADDAPTAPTTSDATTWSDTQKVLLFEGLFAFNSAAAAADPRFMGGLILVTTPLAFAEGTRGPLNEDIVAVTGYGAIGAYDISHYPHVYSRSRVFKENFAAWNLWGGVMLILGRENADSTAAKLAQHMSVMPEAHGGVHVAYRWTF